MALPNGPVLSRRGKAAETLRRARSRFEGLTQSSKPNDTYRRMRPSQHGAARRLMNIITRLHRFGTRSTKSGRKAGLPRKERWL